MPDKRRLFRAQHQDISIQADLGSGKYAVRGTRNITYEVDLQIPSCTCPDWEKREPTDGCKHILAVKIKEGSIKSLSSAKTAGGSQGAFSNRNIPNWDRLARQTKKRDNWTCQHCNKQGGHLGSAELHAHHIEPRSKGGKDTLNNLITVCHSCHEDLHDHRIPSGSHQNFSSPNPGTGTQTSKPATNGDKLQPDTQNHDPDEATQDSESPVDFECNTCGSPIEFFQSTTVVCDNCLAEAAPNTQTDKSPNQGLSTSQSKSQNDFPNQVDNSLEEETNISYNKVSGILLIMSGVSALYGLISFSDSGYFFSMSYILISVYTLPVGLQALIKQSVLTRHTTLPTEYRKKSVILTGIGVLLVFPSGFGVISHIFGGDIHSPSGLVVLGCIGVLLLITRQVLIYSKS